MKHLVVLYIFTFLISIVANAQYVNPQFSGADIVNPKIKGYLKFDRQDQQYTLCGAGYNIWSGRDEFFFAYKEKEGDFILSANLKFLGKGVEPHRKMGLMIRNSKEEDAV